MHRDRAACAGLQMLTGKYPVAFVQDPPRTVHSDCKDFAYHLSHRTDQPRHIPSINRNNQARKRDTTGKNHLVCVTPHTSKKAKRQNNVTLKKLEFR
jgi:hypothetical protein